MKKTLSLLLSFILILSVPAFAEDISGNAPINEIEVLSGLSIIPGAAPSEESVTRGEFAYYLVQLAKTPEANYSVKFADVGAQHKYFKQIMQINATNAMVGKSEYLFFPDDTLTIAEAAKTLVCMLGYDSVAMYEGGYPSGYLSVASRIDLFDGVPSTGELSKNAAYRLIYNALEIPWAERETYGNKPSAIIKSENSFLKTNFDLTHIEDGILSANEYSSLSSEVGCRKGGLVIGGEEYSGAEVLGDIPLGASVDAYYREENGVNVIKYITTSKRYSYLEIYKNDIESFTLSQVSYYDGVREFEATISGTADFIFNGVYTGISNISAEDKQNSSLLLIDADGNGVYETVHINRYDVYFADSVYADAFTIHDLVSESRVMFDEESDIVVYNEKNQALGFESLAKNKLISVTKSKNGKLVKMYISAETDGGEVSDVDANGFTINSNYYTVNANVKKYNMMPSPGDMGTIYVDKNGEVGVFISKISGGMEYGYLIDGANESSGLRNDYKLQILNSFGEIHVYSVADRFEIDGRDFKKTDAGAEAFASLAMDHLNGGAQTGSVVPQLIAYALDGEDRVIAIDTEYMDAEYEDDTSLSSKYMPDEAKSMSEYTGFYAAKAYLDTNSLLVFNVPSDYNYKDAKYYSVGNFQTLVTTYNASAKLKLYNEDDVNRAKLAVNYIDVGSGNASVSSRSDLFLVDYVSQYNDAEGVQGYKIYGLYDNKHVGYPIEEETYKSLLPAGRESLKRGDILQIAIDGFGSIMSYVVRYDIDNRLDFDSGLPYNNNWQTENHFFNGTVYAALDDHFVLQYGWSEKYDDSFFNNSNYYSCKITWGGFHIYDEERDEVRVATIADLKSYKDYGNEASKLFCRFDYGQCVGIVILKFKSN